jgi:hypothetical protein
VFSSVRPSREVPDPVSDRNPFAQGVAITQGIRGHSAAEALLRHRRIATLMGYQPIKVASSQPHTTLAKSFDVRFPDTHFLTVVSQSLRRKILSTSFGDSFRHRSKVLFSDNETLSFLCPRSVLIGKNTDK